MVVGAVVAALRGLCRGGFGERLHEARHQTDSAIPVSLRMQGCRPVHAALSSFVHAQAGSALPCPDIPGDTLCAVLCLGCCAVMTDDWG